jgi:hypothetical protein
MAEFILARPEGVNPLPSRSAAVKNSSGSLAFSRATKVGSGPV